MSKRSTTISASASTEDGRKQAHEELRFLWAKWAHHDQLIHSRFNLFWQLHTISFGFLALVMRSGQMTRRSIGFLALVSLVAAVIGFALRQMAEVDRLVRNGYNLQIVSGLRKANFLVERTITEDGWRADAWDHPANLWHVPSGYTKSWDVAASKLAVWIGWIVLTIDLVACAFLTYRLVVYV